MAYTLEQLAADCKAALQQNDGPDGRAQVRAASESLQRR